MSVMQLGEKSRMPLLLDECQNPGTSDGVVGSDVGHDCEFTGERHVATDKATEERLRMVSTAHIFLWGNIP